ncbi:MAG: glutamate--tRNA ligase [Candidatus Saccharimonadales bacterium]|nr:glutamate--tRNA ligase [Candidatus Saccharimonadales bacterium]
MNVRSRFAPSPTGFLHVGGIRTALFAWALAKQADGTFILRIEDTDKARQVEGSIEHIIESLKWLGIEWQEGPDIGGEHGPYLQSERLEIYRQWAQKLIDKGLAYVDPYSSEELDSFRREAQSQKQPFLYRSYRPKEIEVPDDWYGRLPLRFKTPVIKRFEWLDEVRGSLSAGEEALDDFVLIKADGYPTYNFAHVLDDYLMKISHVIRGEEFISSMPKFLSLMDALEIEHPKFVTAPPILNPNGGKKLSKRDGAKDILDYRDEGYLPAAVANFLMSLGWNDGTDNEIYALDEFIERFSVERMQKSGAKFDPSKLDWINWQHIMRLIEESRYDAVRELIGNDAAGDELIKLAATKANSLEALEEQVRPANFQGVFLDELLNRAAKDVGIDTSQASAFIEAAISSLEDSSFDQNTVEQQLRGRMQDLNAKPRQFLGLIRWIVSQKKVSPSLFELIAVLGREETLKRLRAVLD